jgi:hypothetical protein
LVNSKTGRFWAFQAPPPARSAGGGCRNNQLSRTS